ncbi:DUF3108 domain-containing protein [Pseudolabrys sp.]|uniref:DUF3108 domain-containing protein n=1 Tax=Pseudolabrys sp. TaxID=1960880 RepID=UPI003D13C76E
MAFRLITGLRAGLVAAAGVLALGLGVAADPASAQAKLDAKYTATLAGLPIGKGSWVLNLDEDAYTSTMSGGTSGLVKLFAGGHGTSTVRGVWAGDRSVGSVYSSEIKTKRKTDRVDITVESGRIKDFKVSPPVDDEQDRVPITDAEKRGVTDPMTGSMIHVPVGDLLSPGVCKRTLPLFDGRYRYNLKLTFKRMETVKAAKGYAGAAVVCSVLFAPVAGFVPDRSAIKYLVAMRDAEVWLVPVQGTRMLVPFRVEVPTPLGTGALEAREFIVTPRPVKAAIKRGKT